ncbi:RCC1 repeat-containing protein [Bifidobacterium margollesii]|uniref:RCC1 repeat-containing protein n=1 Tax=Bifidobacterium margollesii TaxID=2020964 RepID=A0A2N5J8W3_9BIFI|nr:RCC1 repeat-containing protein [Bifidobacterium margollesii]
MSVVRGYVRFVSENERDGFRFPTISGAINGTPGRTPSGAFGRTAAVGGGAGHAAKIVGALAVCAALLSMTLTVPDDAVSASETAPAFPSEGLSVVVGSSDANGEETAEAAGDITADHAGNDATDSGAAHNGSAAGGSSAAGNTWASVRDFASGVSTYASYLQQHGTGAMNCASNAGCRVSTLRDAGTVAARNGLREQYQADAAGGMVTSPRDHQPQSVRTYTVTLKPRHTGKFRIASAQTMSGTRPAFVISAYGQLNGGENAGSYTYAGFLGDQKGAPTWAGTGSFGSWLTHRATQGVYGDYVLGNRSADICPRSLCRAAAGTESNWIYFHNGGYADATITIALTARGINASGSAARLAVSYDEEDSSLAVPVYRVYNRRSGLHHYTTSAGEKNSLVRLGWRYEGVSFKAVSQGGKPVYRVYNRHDGNHLWTMNLAERNHLVRLGWRAEGVAWRVPSNGVRNVYRLYNRNSGEHVYTTSLSEYNAVVRAGWRGEHVAWTSLY